MSSKPIFNLISISENMAGGSNTNMAGGSNTNMAGGSNINISNHNDVQYEHGARKYHYKIQKKLKSMIANGQLCPSGHEKYLRSFKEATSDFSNMQHGGNGDDIYKYKTEKYHYKNQEKLRSMMANGSPCPQGYEKYLKPFEAS
jgi:hypothetical protein